MKIKRVAIQNRRRAFELTIGGRVLTFPFAKCRPTPTPADPVTDVAVDPELAREAFTYTLARGRQGTVHLEQVLDYHKDPSYLRDQILYDLTVQAHQSLELSPLSKRELIRRLDTSATQFYRLLDPTNYRKSIDQMLRLLSVLDCQVEFKVRAKTA
jgi:hypothetical protein